MMESFPDRAALSPLPNADSARLTDAPPAQPVGRRFTVLALEY